METPLSAKNLKNRLEEAGVQASAPRMAIASYVWTTCSHPTAEEIKVEVEKSFPMVSLATIYNTLKLFVAKGLLIEVRDPRMKSIRYDCKTSPHYHFFDEVTGEVFDLEEDSLKITPHLPQSFHITGMDIIVRGRKNNKAPHKRTPSNEKPSPLSPRALVASRRRRK